MLNQGLSRLHLQHFLWYGSLNFREDDIQQCLTDEITIGNQNQLAGRYRNSKRTHQLLLLSTELHNGKFRNKGDALSTFHHSHEGFHATQVIRQLTGL